MLPGTVIDGTYVVDRVLGEGGMGVVVAAHHIATRALVAIKLLKSTGNETHTRRFLRELRAASKLRNPHCARVYGWGQLSDGRPYMAMEMLDGPDLETLLASSPLPPRLAATYVMQACAGLAEAHARGIVHRDIKPANLMLSRGPTQPIVKVVDFGIATPACDDNDDMEITAVHTVIGSVNYMSPEQVRSSELDPRSDVWSLGVTLYELIAGRHPFPGDSFAQVALAIAGDPHQPLVEAHPGIAAIVDRCLEKDADDRYNSVIELAAALAPFALSHAPDVVQMRAPARVDRGSGLRLDSSETPLAMEPVRRRRPPSKYTNAWIAVAIAAVALVGFSVLALGGGEVPNLGANVPSVSAPQKPIVTPIEPTP